MRIFLSYGHDYINEVSKIAADLTALGYDVWIDKEKIRIGSDWRDKITEGILDSDVVLVFLSAYGFREGGVCHDELTIAVSCNRRIIKPILMEKRIEHLIPSSITGIQYLDLSDWRSVQREEFSNWYDVQFQNIVELCKDDTIKYEKQLELINNKLHVTLSFTRELFELRKYYEKRKWLEQQIETWLANDEDRTCLLIGYPGFGKSCFSTNFFHYNINAIGLIYCEWDRTNNRNALQIIKQLAFQLASQIPSFRTRLVWVLNNSHVNWDKLNCVELFDFLLIGPFTMIDGNHAPLLLILDGVDECTENGSNELADVFSSCVDRLPRFIKLLVTTRNDGSVLRYYSSAKQIQLLPEDAHTFDELKLYIHTTLRT